jgi:hypothetical protein
MINADPQFGPNRQAEDEAVDSIVADGAGGAKMLAGLSTGVVIGLWIAFYFLVFVPRSAP